MTHTNSLPIELAAAEIAAAAAPYISERFDSTDPRWLEVLDHTSRKYERKWHELRQRGPEAAPRAQRVVSEQYESHWDRADAETQIRSGRQRPFVWRDERMLAHSVMVKRIYHLLLRRTLEHVQPASVLELGCGNGVNLAVLRSHFPATRFAGVELTAAGARAAAALLRAPALPPAVREFVVGDATPPSAAAPAFVTQGSGQAIPLASGSVDVSFTVLALEQMEAIRADVMRELRRVTRRYVAMIEPFHEWNQSPLQRHFIESSGYFDQRIDRLSEFGLEPVATYVDVPHKITFAAGLVVARVV